MKSLITVIWSYIIAAIFSRPSTKTPVAKQKIADKDEYLELETFIAKAPKFRAKSAEDLIVVPVAVHIIHRGEDIGKGTNISDAQIYSAITAANEDFSKALNTRGDGVGVPTPFRFVLANKDDKGNFTTGIYRVNGSEKSTVFHNNGIQSGAGKPGLPESIVKSWSRQDNQKIYNIWIVPEIDNNNGGGGVQGFAYYPTTSAVDGTVIMYNAFGKQHPDYRMGYTETFNLKSYTKYNRTLTHELGHAFALYHTFHSMSCIDDTNQWNYMSYANENLKNGFAQCQLDRMILVSLASRKNLCNSSALENMHQIVADAEVKIVAPLAMVCKNSKPVFRIRVTNKSSNPIHRLQFRYEINDKVFTHTWYGAIAPKSELGNYEFDLAKIPVTQENIELKVTITNINGNKAKVSDSLLVHAPDRPPFKLEFLQDVIAGQISWDIQDKDGRIVYKSPKYENFKPLQLIQHDLCLIDGEYKLNLWDVQAGFQTEGAYIRLLDGKRKEIFKTIGGFSHLEFKFKVGEEAPEPPFKALELEHRYHPTKNAIEVGFTVENDKKVDGYTLIKALDAEFKHVEKVTFIKSRKLNGIVQYWVVDEEYSSHSPYYAVEAHFSDHSTERIFKAKTDYGESNWIEKEGIIYSAIGEMDSVFLWAEDGTLRERFQLEKGHAIQVYSRDKTVVRIQN